MRLNRHFKHPAIIERILISILPVRQIKMKLFKVNAGASQITLDECVYMKSKS